MNRLPPKSERLLFRIPEVAELLGRPANAVWKGIRDGTIEHVRITGIVRIKHDEVARLMRGIKKAGGKK
jgi:hypothetical protein